LYHHLTRENSLWMPFNKQRVYHVLQKTYYHKIINKFWWHANSWAREL